MSTLRVRWASDEEIARWDELIAQNPRGAEAVQSYAFTQSKALVGATNRFIVFERDGEIASVAYVLERKVPGMGAMWFLGRAPSVVDVADFEQHLVALRDFIDREARDVFVLTVEPALPTSEEAEAAIAASPVLQGERIQRGPGIQFNAVTAIVPLEGTDEELLASFDPKNRNKIRRADRDGVEIRDYPPTQETFDHMHRLQTLVGGGAKAENEQLLIHPREYTEQMWKTYIERGQGFFVGADGEDGEPAVMAFVLTLGDRAFYKEGGSERPRQSPGMANLMQFRIIQRLRDAGVKEYDMGGVAPEGAGEEHTNYSLGKFKLGFGPRVTSVGSFTIYRKPLRAQLWDRIGERVYARLYRQRTGDFSIY